MTQPVLRADDVVPAASRARVITVTTAATLAGALGGYLLILGIRKLLGWQPGLAASPSALATSALLAGVVSIAIHELGHVVAGLSRGFRFLLYVAGPLKVVKDGGGIQMGMNLDAGLAGGLVLLYPRVDHLPTTDLRRDLLFLYAGGPAASLVLASTALLLMVLVPAWQHSALAPLLPLTFLISFGISIVTMIPLRSTFSTDGAQIKALAEDGDASRSLQCLVRVMAQSLSGLRPASWNRDDVGELTAKSNDGSAQGSSLLLYHYALDGGNVEEAAGWLDRALEEGQRLPRAFRAELFLEGAYFEALHRRNLVAARSWLRRAPQRSLLDTQVARLRAEAAIALASDQPKEALVLSQRGLDTLAARSAGPVSDPQANWLLEIRERAARAGS